MITKLKNVASSLVKEFFKNITSFFIHITGCVYHKIDKIEQDSKDNFKVRRSFTKIFVAQLLLTPIQISIYNIVVNFITFVYAKNIEIEKLQILLDFFEKTSFMVGISLAIVDIMFFVMIIFYYIGVDGTKEIITKGIDSASHKQNNQ